MGGFQAKHHKRHLVFIHIYVFACAKISRFSHSPLPDSEGKTPSQMEISLAQVNLIQKANFQWVFRVSLVFAVSE